MRYARRLGATLLAALATASLVFLPAAPASAGEPADLRLEVRQGNLASQSGGQPATLVFAVTNDGPSKADAFNANVVIPFGDRGVYLASSSPSCNQVSGPTVLACPVNELEVGQTTVFTLVIGAPPAGSLQPTDAFTAPGQITVDAGGDDPNGANDSSQFTLNLTGAPPGVTQINGTVADGQSGNPIAGASVVARDVNGATCLATTDATGAFNCTPSQPLAGGKITIEATMAGFQLRSTTVMPNNGQVTDVRLALDPAVASASPTPSAAPTSASPAASAPPQAIKSDDDGFPWDTVLVVLGIVLALGGLGAVGWWMYKRKDKDSGGPSGPGNPQDLPDLVAAESIMPTMPMRVPNSVLSETTVANQPPFGQLDSADAPTAAWGVPSPDGNWVNRSTEPIQVSGAAGGWSGSDAGRGGSASGERTAEWPTIDPSPSEADSPASGIPASGVPSSAAPSSGAASVPGRVAPSDPTTAWPAMSDGDAGWAAAPYNRAAGPLSDQYASALPAEAPAVPSGPPASGGGFDQSWGTPNRSAYGSPEYSSAPEYGGVDHGAVDPAPAPLAGWDTPPAAAPAPASMSTRPMSAPPLSMSAPPMSAPPMPSSPMSTPPMPSSMSAPPMPMSGPPTTGYPATGYPATGYPSHSGAGYPGAPGPVPPAPAGPPAAAPTAQWPAPSFPASAPPAPGYPTSGPGYPGPTPPSGYAGSAPTGPNYAPPGSNYPGPAPSPSNYPASAPPAGSYSGPAQPLSAQPMSAPPMPGRPMSAPPMPGSMSGPPGPGSLSGAPIAGGPMPGAPMSGPPMSGPPMPGQQQPSGSPSGSYPASAPPAGYAPGASYGGYPSSAPPANYGPPSYGPEYGPQPGQPSWQQQGYPPPYQPPGYPPATSPMSGPPAHPGQPGHPNGSGYPNAAYPASAPPANGSPYGSYPPPPGQPQPGQPPQYQPQSGPPHPSADQNEPPPYWPPNHR